MFDHLKNFKLSFRILSKTKEIYIMLDADFYKRIMEVYNPFTPLSGTENLAPALYWLIRMRQCQTVTEFGTGYTTPFLAKALADNYKETLKNKEILKEKSSNNRRSLERALAYTELSSDSASVNEAIMKELSWLISGTPPIAPNPFFYQQDYKPQLFVWEELPETHEYVKKLHLLMDDLELSELITITSGASIENHISTLPKDRRFIDFAWNDCGSKVKFFEETYQHVNPEGGLFAFHGPEDFRLETHIIKEKLKEKVDTGLCEFLTLIEPHKVSQNSCFLVRKSEQTPNDPIVNIKESIETLLTLCS